MYAHLSWTGVLAFSCSCRSSAVRGPRDPARCIRWPRSLLPPPAAAPGAAAGASDGAIGWAESRGAAGTAPAPGGLRRGGGGAGSGARQSSHGGSREAAAAAPAASR